KISCQGFKGSILRDNVQYYTPVCFDGKSEIFWKTYENYSGVGFSIWYENNQGYCLNSSYCSTSFCTFSRNSNRSGPATWITDADIKNALDNSRGVSKFCGSWSR